MLEANEALGCPRKYFIFVPQNFSRPFLSVVKFQDNSLAGCPLPCCIMPRQRHFSLHFLPYTYISFTKTGPLDAPQVGCPGPSHRPHPPLHATEQQKLEDA